MTPGSVPHLLLLSVRRRSFRSGSDVRVYRAPAHLLCYVESGRGTVRIDDEENACKPGKLIGVPSGARVELSRTGADLKVYLLMMEIAFLKRRRGQWEAAGKSGQPHLLPWVAGEASIGDPLPVRERIETLYRLKRDKASDPFVVNAFFQELIHYLATRLDRPGQASHADGGIERSVDYMHDRYREKIKLETLSELSGFTPTSYSREFKKVKGVSPIDYLNAYRIGQAKQLLAERTRAIKEVASECGFGNEFYFSRTFKRHEGMSPSHYRKRTSLRIAVASALRFQDILESLGAVPVYWTNCHKTKTMDKPTHQAMVDLRLNEIREAAPDLIVCDHYHLPFLDRLKEIAPAVRIELSMDWRVNYRRLAAVAGKEAEAERNFKRLDRKVEQARKRLKERYGDETVTILRVVHKLIRIQGLSGHPLNDLIYGDLGLKPGFCVPSDVKSVEFSPDNYPDLDTDHLFVQNLFFRPEDETAFASIANGPEWKAIRAVKNDRVRLTPNWVRISWTPEGRMRIIDELLQ